VTVTVVIWGQGGGENVKQDASQSHFEKTATVNVQVNENGVLIKTSQLP
jgi:hypothetical protein